MTKEVNEQNLEEVSRIRFKCPHCGSHMKIRSSKTLLEIYRVIYWHCTNEWECGFRSSGFMQMVHTLAHSRRPNPEVQLENSPTLLRQMGFDFDETPINDPNYDEEPK